ncbi:hypothetical protein [Pseudomonas fluorescens]|uniref:hypothetical protein n=1 Tax=Pseudomonas fluorescens TaxID=294 RepID=UPI00259AEFC1|nr:hypothetical protein [Pseudomonas fluorescens]WJK12588.1 hypothetical protein QR290_19155 [Pseudomonas fluorescens]
MGEEINRRQFQNARQHKGEPKLPFNFVVACSFLLLRVGLLLFLATVALYRCFWRPPSGVKSKRIFLSADLLSRYAIQPIRELPEGSFIVLCPVAGHSEEHPEKHTFSKKIC